MAFITHSHSYSFSSRDLVDPAIQVTPIGPLAISNRTPIIFRVQDDCINHCAVGTGYVVAN